MQLQDLFGKRYEVEVEDPVSGPELHAFAAKTLNIHVERLKLVYRGKAIDRNASNLKMDASAIIIAVPLPRGPDEAIRRAAAADKGLDDDEAELDVFAVPEDARQWERKLAHVLQRKLHLPDYLLIWIFHIGILQIVYGAAVLCIAPVAHSYGMGPPFLLTCTIIGIYGNLGRRRQGDASAYSIFNNFQRLPGQLDADQIDQQVRRGQM